MNHIYRLVWDHRSCSLVAVAETAKGRGKHGGKANTLSAAVAGALMALAAGDAMAVGACVVGTNTTLTTSVAGPCVVPATGVFIVDVAGTVTGGGNLGVLVDTGVAAQSIANSGSITSTKAADTAVLIKGSLTAGFSNLGLINWGPPGNGNGQGLRLDHGTIAGGFNNAGTISSAQTGIRLLFGTVSGGITNSGLIDGDYYGLTVNQGAITGDLLNSGTIHGATSLIEGNTLTGSVVNQGLMTAAFGTLTVGSGVITGGITNTGTVSATGTSSSSAAISLGGSTVHGGITNTGLIEGNTSMSGIGVYESTLENGIHNNIAGSQTGTISGRAGVEIGGASSVFASSSSPAVPPGQGTLSGGITNSGLIQGLAGPGVLLDGGVLEGGIANLAGATITGTDNGITLKPRNWVGQSSPTAPVVSSGSVQSTFTGGITNSGLIEGVNAVGIRVNDTALSGGIDNSGTIQGGSSGIWLEGANTTVTGGIINRATGTISAGADYGIHLVNGASVTGGLTNLGLIDSPNGIGIRLDHSQVDFITNGATGTISGSNGLQFYTATVTGNVTNEGKITSTSSEAVTLGDVTIGGAFINSQGGTIHGADSGLDISDAVIAGHLTNAGTIIGDDIGLFFDGGGAFNLINSGRIEGTGYAGIEFSYGDAWQGHITNTGTISGGTAGVYIWEYFTVDGSITNSGLIEGVDSSDGRGIYMDSSATLTGNIINQAGGTIVGGLDGIKVYDSSHLLGGITNSGLIHGLSGAGVFVDSGSTLAGGILNEATGTIEGGVTGVQVNTDSTVSGSIVNHGLISGGTHSLLLENTSDPFTVTNTGTLQGAAEIGLNTLDLDGATGRVIGSISGAGGTVNINGTFSSEGTIDVGTVNVATGGVFNMNHDVGAAVGGFNNAGLVYVPAAVSARNVTGDYNQAAGGVVRIGLVDGTSNYGKLAVSGNVTLASGTTVDVKVVGTPQILSGAVIPGVIVAGGTLTATPADITVTDDSVFYDFTASTTRDAKALDLVTAVDSTGLVKAVGPETPAANGVAGALQTMFNEGVPTPMQPLFDALGTMTPEEVKTAISQLVPTLAGAGSQAGVNALHSMNKIIQARVESNHGLSSGDNAPDKYMWLRGFGGWADQDDRGGVSGFKSRTGGMVIGADAPITDKVRAGGAFTYARSNINGNSATAPNSVDVDTYELVGYASYNLDPQTDINYQLDIGQNKAKSQRQILFNSTTASANFDSVAIHGSVGIGRVFPLAEHTNMTPSVRADYTHMRTEGYEETGAGPLNLAVQASTYREFLFTGDLKLAHQLGKHTKLVGNVSASYDFVNKQAQTTSSFVGGGPTFVTDGLKVSPWLYRAGIGLIHEDVSGMEYSARYDAEGRTSGYLNQTVSVRLRWTF